MGYVTVYDGRIAGAPSRRRYEGMAAVAIEYCNEAAKPADHIRDAAMKKGVHGADAPNAVEDALQELIEQRLLYAEKGKYFTLALPMNPHL